MKCAAHWKNLDPMSCGNLFFTPHAYVTITTGKHKPELENSPYRSYMPAIHSTYRDKLHLLPCKIHHNVNSSFQVG